MLMQHIKEGNIVEILDYLIEQLNLAKTTLDIEPELRLYEDVGITSLNLIRLITESCKKFGVDMYSLSSQDLAKVKTIEDLATLLNGKIEPVT
jgi:acyl carrier protein